VTLLPRITLEAGILKSTRLVARPFASAAPSRTLALVARRTSPRRRDADLLSEFLIAQHRLATRSGPSGRNSPRP
jgi:LysR family hydrogen peroxide-inducible transcriptional activator